MGGLVWFVVVTVWHACVARGGAGGCLRIGASGFLIRWGDAVFAVVVCFVMRRGVWESLCYYGVVVGCGMSSVLVTRAVRFLVEVFLFGGMWLAVV